MNLRGKRLFWVAAAGLVVTLGFGGFYSHQLISRVVTRMAFGDALRILEGKRSDEAYEKVIKSMVERYGFWFRNGYIDRDWIADKFPASAVTPEAIPAWAFVAAYYKAREGEFSQEFALEEFRAWLDPVLLRPKFRGALVHLLTSDYTGLPTPRDQNAGMLKELLCLYLLGVDHHGRLRGSQYEQRYLDQATPFFAAVKPRHWRAIRDDCDHPNELVRGGAVLMLYCHPSRVEFTTKAHASLQDSSRWVRLAAAGTLALADDPSGADQLAEGLSHDRWEVRFWCALNLSVLKDRRYLPHLRARVSVETDRFVKDQLKLWMSALE